MFSRGSIKAERDAAFTAFVDGATPSLMRTAWLLCGDGDQAQELVQAALVKTYVAWPRVKEDTALAYARRVLVNHRTDSWRRTRRELTFGEVPEQPADPDVRPDDRDTIVRLLGRLPEQQRTVVVLRYYNDLSERAVAARSSARSWSSKVSLVIGVPPRWRRAGFGGWPGLWRRRT